MDFWMGFRLNVEKITLGNWHVQEAFTVNGYSEDLFFLWQKKKICTGVFLLDGKF